MGYSEFLVGANASAPSTIPKAIADLEDASTLFMTRWQRRELDLAGAISERAMILLDFIANELLREKDKRLGLGSYHGSPFAAEMSALCGTGVAGTSLADQQAMVQAGPGNGHLPTSLGAPTAEKLDRLLNKIKHRSPSLMNFRIDIGRHVFVISAERTGGGAEGIYEFDVADFCARVSRAAQTI